MLVIAIFILFAAGLDAVGVAICMVVERFSEPASLLVFLGFFVLNFIIAWQLAWRFTERFLLSDAQRQSNDEHMKWVNARFAGARR